MHTCHFDITCLSYCLCTEANCLAGPMCCFPDSRLLLVYQFGYPAETFDHLHTCSQLNGQIQLKYYSSQVLSERRNWELVAEGS
jgi:hypothetical protein